MAKILVALGLGWATLGVISLVTMSARLKDDSGGMAAFGLLLNYVIFIVPGLVVAIVAGLIVWRRSRRLKQSAARPS